MVEQLDLFAESENEEQETNTLTNRQKALLKYIEENSLIHHRKTTQKEICEYINGYEWNYDEKCHDHCPAVWKDIKDINLSDETDYVIISKDFEYWIGNKEETQEFLNQLWKDLCPRLVRYWNYKTKVARNGQGQLFSTKLNPIDENSKARAFIESYGKENISGN
ncbi:hypothetical protein IKJ53_06330 [bacterium]|nr:hypothetical protein [bacterium]